MTRAVRRARRLLPLTLVGFAVVSGYLAVRGVRYRDVFGDTHPLNPLHYVASMLFHVGPAHFWANVWLFLVAGVALTWLTSDRHVLAVILTAGVLEALVATWVLREMGVGASGVVFALLAAVAVRSAAVATGEGEVATLAAVALGLVLPFGGGLILVALLAGTGSDIAHFSHFLGFLFGAAVEGIYVVSERERERFDRERESGPTLLHER